MRKRVFRMWTLTYESCLPIFGSDYRAQHPCIFPTRAEAEMNFEDGDLIQRVKVTIEPIGRPRKPRESWPQ
jgi:hypothetical protein